MLKELPSLSPVTQAVFRAERTRLSLPDLGHTTLPLPVSGPEGTLWGVWFTRTEKNEDTGALRLAAPEYGLFFRADFGTFAELRALGPRDFGLPEAADPWLGELTDAADREPRRARLLELLQLVAPSFAAGPRALTPTAKQAAAELKTLFPDVAEPPLVPCYRRASKRFFAWLDFASA